MSEKQEFPQGSEEKNDSYKTEVVERTCGLTGDIVEVRKRVANTEKREYEGFPA